MNEELGEIRSVDEHGNPANLAILEEAGVAFDPTTMHLDLSKEEKRRTTALMMAIQAYKNLIIPDGAYLKEAADLARRGDGPKIHPATIDAMVEAAIKFDWFITGGGQVPAAEPTGGGSQTQVDDVITGSSVDP